MARDGRDWTISDRIRWLDDDSFEILNYFYSLFSIAIFSSSSNFSSAHKRRATQKARKGEMCNFTGRRVGHRAIRDGYIWQPIFRLVVSVVARHERAPMRAR